MGISITEQRPTLWMHLTMKLYTHRTACWLGFRR